MKWITRENVKVDRVACPWLIKKFVDPEAEFLFVPADQVSASAQRGGAVPFDVANVEVRWAVTQAGFVQPLTASSLHGRHCDISIVSRIWIGRTSGIGYRSRVRISAGSASCNNHSDRRRQECDSMLPPQLLPRRRRAHEARLV